MRSLLSFENTFIQKGGGKEKNAQEKKPSMQSGHHSNGRGAKKPQYGRSRRSKNSLFFHLVPGACVNICMYVYIHTLTRCMQSSARACVRCMYGMYVCDLCMRRTCAMYACIFVWWSACVYAHTFGRGMGCIQSLRMYARHSNSTTSAQGCRCRLAQ